VDPSHGWERNKAQTRLALVRAAAQLFRQKGYAATTVDDIATAAGCSARTFFRYFGAKEDVLFMDTAEMVADFTKLVAEPVPGLTRWDQIRMGLNMTARRMAEPNSGIEESIVAMWLTEPAIGKRFGAVIAELERVMAQALAEEQGVDPDSSLPIQLMARGATAGFMSVFHVHVHTGRDLDELLDEALHVVENRTVPFSDIARVAAVPGAAANEA
jgi:AcrR family transcriptional regulator